MAVFAEKHYPESLPANTLDHYLEKGWYRMGQSIFTTHFLCFEENLYSAIWVRLDLNKHHYSKSQRKLMRRNAQQFRVEYAPLQITPEKEALYQKYKANFPGFIARSLTESLLDEEDINLYQTIEVQVYDNDRLVALSFFDLGHHAAASILGIYDPDYETYSLGYYTMLLEMHYCQDKGFSYYYPGYVVPGYRRFDYKLRIGKVDYLQLSSLEWVPFDDLGVADTPLAIMQNQLNVLSSCLKNTSIPNKTYGYPLFEANLFGLLQGAYLDFPIILSLGNYLPHASYFYWVVYDIRDGFFKLLECSSNDDFRFYFQENYLKNFNPEHFLLELVVVQRLLASTPSAEELANLIDKHQEQLIIS
jgi:arginine-tRNA-protein transferase